MISLVFQLTGGLLLAFGFAIYQYPYLPVKGQKPVELKAFLFSQVRVFFGILYLMIGYILPYLGYEFMPENNKIVIALIAFAILFFISFFVSITIGEFLEKRSKPYNPANPPTYNIFHILFNKS